MQAVKLPTFDPSRDSPPSHPALEKLAPADDAMLSLGNFGNHPIPRSSRRFCPW
jgi:hypothetical protein